MRNLSSYKLIIRRVSPEVNIPEGILLSKGPFPLSLPSAGIGVDPAAVAVTIVTVKLSAMAWFRITD